VTAELSCVAAGRLGLAARWFGFADLESGDGFGGGAGDLGEQEVAACTIGKVDHETAGWSNWLHLNR
jgi:hypothetical protein